ncbi:Phosphoribosylaminoimidazole-succinocarboxamide synthase [Trichinella spiralis]|uniref:Phosphoribosylaminoimidazole-succinocarboxamide synthase n=1 Tax=Trichinella spiralis TaxID=6334 RepID=A0ABR3L121_TRISP
MAEVAGFRPMLLLSSVTCRRMVRCRKKTYLPTIYCLLNDCGGHCLIVGSGRGRRQLTTRGHSILSIRGQAGRQSAKRNLCLKLMVFRVRFRLDIQSRLNKGRFLWKKSSLPAQCLLFRQILVCGVVLFVGSVLPFLGFFFSWTRYLI